MVPLEIKWCVPDGTDPGGVKDYVGGDGWSMSENVAAAQWFGGQRFFTKVRGVRAEVSPVRNAKGGYYLRTHPDSTLTNNLGLLCRAELRGWKLPSSRGALGQAQVRNALAAPRSR